MVFLTMDSILKILFVQGEHFKGLDKSVFGITKNVALSVKNANLSTSVQSVMDHTQRRNVEIKAGAVCTELYSLGESPIQTHSRTFAH
jgi:hypothetical protein